MKKLLSIVLLLSSCSVVKVQNISKPTGKAIRKAMEQSTSDYRSELSAKYFYQVSFTQK